MSCYAYKTSMKYYFILLAIFYSFGASAIELIEANAGNCQEMEKYINSHVSEDGRLDLDGLQGDVKRIRLGDFSIRKKYGLSASKASSIQRLWIRYEDIDNDQKKELFAEWTSYANTYTDNRSSIYIFDYPNDNHLEDVFLKGKYKSAFYPDVEAWMVKSFSWDSYGGPVDANDALPSTLNLSPNDVWRAGSGFSTPPNDYILKVFSFKNVHYILVSGRHDKQGKGYVIKLINAGTQNFKTICKLGAI